MKIYEKLNNKLKQSLLFFEDSNLLDYFDNNCILFGSCMLKLLNDISEYPYKFNIICNWEKTKQLNKYLLNNQFVRKIIKTKKIYKFFYKNPENINQTFTFKIFVDEIPIKNISNYTLLKIEEIYYDSKIKYNYEKELLNKTESIDMEPLPMTERNIKILKKIFKYIQYDYCFLMYKNEKLICVFNESYSKIDRLKKIFRPSI